jgi:hypothetical protein
MIIGIIGSGLISIVEAGILSNTYTTEIIVVDNDYHPIIEEIKINNFIEKLEICYVDIEEEKKDFILKINEFLRFNFDRLTQIALFDYG